MWAIRRPTWRRRTNPDSARARNIEFGFRGAPIGGVYYDVCAFRIDLNDKIEQRALTVSDLIRVDSGDSRHRGLEGSLEWEVLNPANQSDSPSLRLFANGAWLDAEITRSESMALIGNVSAFAPRRILRAGAQYRSPRDTMVSLTTSHVSGHYWQDSNRGSGSGASSVDAVVPSYKVADISAEYPLTDSVRLMVGIGNLLDTKC